MPGKSNFYEKVYELVARIPEGYVATYSQIAGALGHPRSARIVGFAMRNAPKDRGLPCHRVVNKAGRLAPEYVFGGKDFQRFMLLKEGITFTREGCINMKKHLWQGL